LSQKKQDGKASFSICSWLYTWLSMLRMRSLCSNSQVHEKHTTTCCLII